MTYKVWQRDNELAFGKEMCTGQNDPMGKRNGKILA